MSYFLKRLNDASSSKRSLVCVGLDPDPSLMPISDVLGFTKAIVDATKDLVCAYKPNISFYEALGFKGMEYLSEIVTYIRLVAPGVLVIGDGKRGDISSSNIKYAKAMFDVWGFDATTVNAYAGGHSLEPFFSYEDRGVFIWCRSSNASTDSIQDLTMFDNKDSVPLYECVAKSAVEWNTRGNVGLVAGATFPREIKVIRSHCRDMPLLIPAIGAQGGDLSNALKHGLDVVDFNVIINSSRSILYPPNIQSKDFDKASRDATLNLRDTINAIILEEGRRW